MRAAADKSDERVLRVFHRFTGPTLANRGSEFERRLPQLLVIRLLRQLVGMTLNIIEQLTQVAADATLLLLQIAHPCLGGRVCLADAATVRRQPLGQVKLPRV